MHSDNQSTTSTIKKRTRDENELLEDIPPAEKHPKLELNNTCTSYENEEKNGQQIIEKELSEIISQVYRSYLRNLYLDFIWKSEIPRRKFESDWLIRETISNREGTEFFLSLSNLLYSGTMSSSLIFAFQNGKGLSLDEFDQDLKTINSTMLNDFNQHNEKESFTKPANVTRINFKLNNKNLSDANFSEKNHEDIEIDISNQLENANSNNKNENNEDHSNDNGENSQAQQSQTQSENQNDSNGSVNTIIDDSNVYSDSVQSNGSSSESCNLSSKSKNSSNGEAYSNNYYKSNCSSQATQVQENAYTSKIFDGVGEDLRKLLKGRYYDPKKSEIDVLGSNGGRSQDSNNQHDDNVTYDISISFTVVNFRTFTLNFKEVKRGEILIKEIPLNTFFYTSILPKDDQNIVVELSIKKNHNFNTGFTGIINQAMTCYMNSMLQTLNVLGYFKKALYQVPVENTDLKTNSVVYSLQRLFYDLLTEEEPVSTSRLTKSFGWSDDEIFIQHDVQEFNLLLCDIMENRMKGTKAEGTFKFLFEGKILNCIDCIDVNYLSKKEESFYDLQLTVKGCKSIYESFNKYTEDEIMDGEDKYLTDEYGKQKAKKFLKFLNFPPVLILQLKRFEYNPRKDQMDKINDNFQFYEEIDLSPYKASQTQDENITMENSDDERYSLHSIVVHKGNINNGHYFAYIRPYTNDAWYLFNDEIVREADYDEVFTCNYGGMQEIYKHRDRGVISKINSKQDGNAYILVYIKNSMRDSILQRLTRNDIPEQTRDLIDKEKAYEKKMREEILRKTRNIDIFLLSKQDILNYNGLGITPSVLEIEKEENLFSLHDTYLNLPKDLRMKDFRRFVSQNTGIPEQFLLIFTFILVDPNKITGRNKFKMNHLNEDIIENKTMNEISDIFYFSKFCLKTIYLYIDCKIPNIYGDYKLLTRSENQEEGETEHILNNEEKSIIYINNKNKMKFYFNNDFMEKFNLKIQHEEISSKINKIYFNKDYLSEPQAAYKLIFFKLSQFDKNSLKIDDIVPIIYSGEIDESLEIYKEKYKSYLQTQLASILSEEVIKQLDDIEFLLEKTSGSYDKQYKILNLTEGDIYENNSITEANKCLEETENKNESENNERSPDESEFLVNIENFSDVCLENNNRDSFILVPYLKRKKILNTTSVVPDEQVTNIGDDHNGIEVKSTFQYINRIWDNTFNYVYLAVLLKKPDNTEILIKNQKFPFILCESQSSILKRLFSYINDNNNAIIKELLTEDLESFVLDDKKVLYKYDDYIERLTQENLFIYNFKVNLNILAEVNKYPLLKFIGVNRSVASHKIDFKINFLRQELTQSGFDLTQIILFDIDNNPFAKLILIIPSQLRICEEIIEYLYSEVLVNFPQYANSIQNNFYFLIQNDRGSFAYDVFSNRQVNLFQFKHMSIPIVYRLQPYTEEEIELMNGEDITKLFCAFATKEGKVACDPLVFYRKSHVTVKEIKLFLLEKMNRIDRLRQCYGEITLQKVKFYTYSLVDYNPVKDVLLLNSKDEEGIFNYFKKSGAYNLLVEFLVVDVNLNKTESKNANGFLNDSLSLKQNFLS